MKLQIIKTGKQTDSAGIEHDFNEERLKKIAAGFDAQQHKPPLVIGHPKADDPALGWVQNVEYNEETKTLDADVGEFVPAFAEALDKNMYKRWSVSLYPNDSVRHLGFLGAMPPAIKGLASSLTGNYSFSEDENGILCFDFGENDNVWDLRKIGGMFRGLRDYFIAEKGIEEANKILPDYGLAELENKEYKQEQHADALFNENNQPTNQKGDAMTPEEKAEFDKLKAQNAEFAEKQTTLEASLATANGETLAAKEALAGFKADAENAEHKSFCEGLVAVGKMRPADVERNIKNLAACAKQDTTLDFGEGDNKSVSMLDGLKANLESAPIIADFSEKATNESAATKTALEAKAAAEFSEGNVDLDRMTEFNEAKEYAEKNNVTFEQALELTQKAGK
tara:strand:+ start:2314 stop:3498 length:1185 start_codon:yes stop_codon:yes gene_type:complete